MSKDDEKKTREQLVAELRQLRREVARLNADAARAEPTRRTGSYDAVVQAIAANVPVTLFALDLDGNITLSEGLGLRALGLEPGEMVGRNVLEEFRALPDIEGQLDRALCEVSACTTVELSGVSFEIWHTAIRDGQGRPAGVAGIALDVTEQKRAERRLRSGRRRMKRMLRLFEHEHRLMAFDIHDGLVQEITGLQLRLEALLQNGRLPSGYGRTEIGRAAELAGRAVAEARRLIDGLRPPVLDNDGVVAAVGNLIRDRGPIRPEVEFFADVDFERLDPLVEASLYRIIQEAVNNATRHSGAERAQVRLSQMEGRIYLEISDEGVGFDPEQVGMNRFGLQGIRERARLLRGRAVIDSASGHGTRIFVDLPAAGAPGKVANLIS